MYAHVGIIITVTVAGIKTKTKVKKE